MFYVLKLDPTKMFPILLYVLSFNPENIIYIYIKHKIYEM